MNAPIHATTPNPDENRPMITDTHPKHQQPPKVVSDLLDGLLPQPASTQVVSSLGFDVEDDQGPRVPRTLTVLKFSDGSPRMLVLLSPTPISFDRHSNAITFGGEPRFAAFKHDIGCPGPKCPLCAIKERPIKVLHYVVYSLDSEDIAILKVALGSDGKVTPNSLGAQLLRAIKGRVPQETMLEICKASAYAYTVVAHPLPTHVTIPSAVVAKAQELLANPKATLAELYDEYTSEDLRLDSGVQRVVRLRGIDPETLK